MPGARGPGFRPRLGIQFDSGACRVDCRMVWVLVLGLIVSSVFCPTEMLAGVGRFADKGHGRAAG